MTSVLTITSYLPVHPDCMLTISLSVLQRSADGFWLLNGMNNSLITIPIPGLVCPARQECYTSTVRDLQGCKRAILEHSRAFIKRLSYTALSDLAPLSMNPNKNLCEPGLPRRELYFHGNSPSPSSGMSSRSIAWYFFCTKHGPLASGF